MAEEKYNQDFFLALALKGKEAWNAWRCDPTNEGVRVTFTGSDFSEAPRDQINFAGFEFGDYADFSSCKWRGIILEEATLAPGGFNFLVFHPGQAFFQGADFGRKASFSHASFGDWVSFLDATFGQDAFFAGAAFGDNATFTGAAFGAFADFTSTIFEGHAVFDFVAFGLNPKFNDAYFNSWALFRGQSQDQWSIDASTRIIDPETLRQIRVRHEASWKNWLSQPARLTLISFKRVCFGGASFSGRSFEYTADFTGTRFCSPPNFDGVTNPDQIDFTGARIRFVPPGKWHWTTDTQIPLRLRTLRKIAEETKNHDLERDLYIEERKAERGVYLRQRWEDLKKEGWKNWPRNLGRLLAHVLWIFVMFVYWALADYGRSFVRPFACWLVLSLIIFPWSYVQILQVPLHASLHDAYKYEQAVQLVARANAVPFVGPLTIDSDIKKFLFCLNEKDCHPIPSEGYQWLVIGQNLFSIICVFFIGLALRNYFKIK